jgi:hypothetical protein
MLGKHVGHKAICVYISKNIGWGEKGMYIIIIMGKILLGRGVDLGYKVRRGQMNRVSQRTAWLGGNMVCK